MYGTTQYLNKILYYVDITIRYYPIVGKLIKK